MQRLLRICRFSRAAAARLAKGCLRAMALLVGGHASASELPSIASINLCADQLALTLADPEQILTVSWLAADPEESLLAAEAVNVPLNHGSAEELLAFQPDVVLAGAYTNAYTRALLVSLDYRVIALQPEASVQDIEVNVRLVAEAIGQSARAERLIAHMHRQLEQLAHAPAEPATVVVVRPGGFTVGARTLADELITLAGLRNVAAESGLDRWGSLSMETLLRSAPQIIVLTGYRAHQPSLANSVLDHPALRTTRAHSRVVTVPAAYWSCGLPQSVESAILLRDAARVP